MVRQNRHPYPLVLHPPCHSTPGGRLRPVVWSAADLLPAGVGGRLGVASLRGMCANVPHATGWGIVEEDYYRWAYDQWGWSSRTDTTGRTEIGPARSTRFGIWPAQKPLGTGFLLLGPSGPMFFSLFGGLFLW